MKVKSFCASAALLTAFALSPVSAMAADVPAAAAQQQNTATAAATTSSVLPSDVLTNDDGTELKKIYDVAKTVSPAQIPTEDFDRGGLHYTFSELLKIDMPETDHKTHSEQVSVSSSSNSASDVLSLLPKSKAIVTTDGYTWYSISGYLQHFVHCRHDQRDERPFCNARVSQSDGYGYEQYSKEHYRERKHIAACRC